jgi:signal transduction histidine kinase
VARLRPRAPQRTDDEIRADLPRILEDVISTLRSGDGAQSAAVSDLSSAAANLGRQRQRLGLDIKLASLSLGVISAATGELAARSALSFPASDYRLFNECLDEGAASAISEYWNAAHEDQEYEHAKRLGSFAHELRNSLSTATMAFEVLRSGQLGVTGSTGDVLHRSLQRMQGLLAQTLLAATLQARASLHPRRINVEHLLATLAGEAVTERGIDIQVSVEQALEVDADETVLVSAVNNLLQNAVKFTRTGGRVQLKAHATSDGVVCIQVEDECGGLPGGNTQDLFKPFNRGNDRRSTGLGLAITREAVTALGGEVSACDRPGQGCVFSLRLPRAG